MDSTPPPDTVPSAESVWKKPGLVFTFYSYKGGVGRSMALANIAALLARRGRRVLIIDWDLEAPGIERFFLNSPSRLLDSRRDKDGLIDLVESIASGTPLDWRRCLLQARPFDDGLSLSILHAGRDDDHYVRRVQRLSWRNLFEEADFGNALERLRTEWIAEYDYVFIDSRTGITDIGGLCTVHLPDILVLLFTTSEQSLGGVLDVMKRARKARGSLPFDRSRLVAIPVPARDESLTEHDNATQWRQRFERELASLYEEWLPPGKRLDEVLPKISVVYKAYWSFGERLPVAEERVIDPKGPAASYELLADLIDRGLQWDLVTADTPEMLREREERATAQKAESFFNDANAAKQETIRRLLLRLVRVGRPEDADRFSRQKVDLGDLPTGDQGTLQELGDLKLVEIESGPTVDRAQLPNDHLIRQWKRLQAWLEEDRDFLAWRQKTRAAADEWSAHKRPAELLLSGALLTEANQWRQRLLADPAPVEIVFLQASLARTQSGRRRSFALRTAALIGFIAVGAAFWYLMGSAPLPADTPTRPAPVENAQEREPNDTILQENVMSLSQAMDGEIRPSTDVDYFRFDTPSSPRDAFHLGLVMRNNSGAFGLIPSVDVLDSERVVVWSDTSARAEPRFDRDFVLESARRYSIRIRGQNSLGSESAPYAMTIRPLGYYDGYEPNESIDTATRVRVGATIEANLLDSRDVDVYAFRSEGRVRAQVTIGLKKLSLNFKLAISATDEKGVRKGAFSEDSDGSVSGTVQVDPSADSYLTVTGQTAALAARYSLTIK